MKDLLDFILENWFISYLMLTTLIAIISFIFDKTEVSLGTNEYGRFTSFLISLVVIPIILPFVVLIGGVMMFFGVVLLLMTAMSMLIGVVEAILFKN